jgi:hypothetical protein
MFKSIPSNRKGDAVRSTPSTGPAPLAAAFTTLPCFFIWCISVPSRSFNIFSSRSCSWASFSAFSISQTLQTPEVARPTAAPAATLNTVAPVETPERYDPTVIPTAVSVPSNPFDIKYLREMDFTSSLFHVFLSSRNFSRIIL